MIEQVMIGVLGGLAILLLGRGRKTAAGLTGMLSQPFWLMATWESAQWGMFVLSLCYLGIWIEIFCRGLRERKRNF